MQITFTKNGLAEYFPELEQKAINSAWLALNIINSLERNYLEPDVFNSSALNELRRYIFQEFQELDLTKAIIK